MIDSSFKKSTIGSKILTGLLLILALVIGTNSWAFISIRDHLIAREMDRLALLNAMGKSILMEEILNDSKEHTSDFASDGFIRDSAKNIALHPDNNYSALLSEHLIKNKLPLDTSSYGLDVIDNAGRVIASTDASELGTFLSKEIIHQEDMAPNIAYESDFMSVNNFSTSSMSVLFVSLLTDKITGERLGALVNFVKLDMISDQLKEYEQLLLANEHIAELTDINTYIVSKNGYVVDNRHIIGARFSKKSIAVNYLQCGGGDTYVNDSGIQVIGSEICLDNGWKIITEISRKIVLAPIDAIRNDILYMLIVLIVLILAVMYILNRIVIKPIKRLSQVAQAVEKGDLDAEADIASRDEIGELGSSFNAMIRWQKESRALLAKRIREITNDFEKFKLAVEGASDHIIITDAEGIIIYANKAAEETTGYSRSEMLGKRPSLWGKQMPQTFYANMWHTIKDEQKTFHTELTNKRKGGELYIADSYISPLFDDNGILYGFVGIERDITRQKEIDKSKTEFVSVASHQLRTPLTIINWYAEMMASSEPLSDKQRNYLEEIEKASDRMVDLVNSLLNVSRIEMGTFMIEPQPVDFTAVVDIVMQDLSLEASRKKIRIVKNYAEGLPAVPADPKLLQIVFMNLIGNAIKYTPDEGMVTIAINVEDDNMKVSIADTGYGIPANQQSKIFGKFFRADNARIKEPAGNGLGLYITKSIVNYVGGTISFASEEDKGTIFSVTIPLKGMQKREGARALAA